MKRIILTLAVIAFLVPVEPAHACGGKVLRKLAKAVKHVVCHRHR